MEAAAPQEWFLREHEDGNIFRPLPFAQLARWASFAQVAPHNVASTDHVTWVRRGCCLSWEWIS
jgi:hypothetical protein